MTARLLRTLLLGGAALGVTVGAVAAFAASAPAGSRPDFTLAASPSSGSVVAGQGREYDVIIAPSGGFKGSVSLAVSGLPAGASGRFGSDGDSDLDLLVSTSSTSPAGSYPLTITGTSGALRHTTGVTLVVTKPGFTLSVSPANLNVPAGASGSYAVTISRVAFSGSVAFSVSGLPAHSSGAFSPPSTTGNSTTLTVSTTASTTLGSYTLTVTGKSGATTATAPAHLTVSAAQGKNFTITGSADRLLAPGVTGSLNVALTNPNNQPISVTNLAVSLTGTSRSACTTSNFAVGQFSGSYPLTVPANTTRTLSQLGVPQSGWPTVTMKDLPVNQDACKSTTLTLSYTGTGQGA
jgi:Predicted membrane protein